MAAGFYPERIYIFPDIDVVGAGVTTIDATGQGRPAVIMARGGTGRARDEFSIQDFTLDDFTRA